MTPTQTAAERLRSINRIVDMLLVYGRGPTAEQWHLDDLRILASAYLSEHPADDGEAITIEWMCENDWYLEGKDVVTRIDTSLYVSFSSSPPVVFVDVYELGTLRTRGDVRRLLAALGVGK